MNIIDLGLIDFTEAYSIQERLAAEVFAGSGAETLLLLEHPPVYTIGSGGDEGNILDASVEVRRINRGGDVTYHGPGQLVGYPVIDLARRGCDLHRYLRFVEELLMLVVADFRLAAFRVPGRTGVWSARGKLASIGVGVRHWVTMHGFALNVTTDLTPFTRINPCGMAGCPVTSLEAEVGGGVKMIEVKARVGARFEGLLDEFMPLRDSEKDRGV